ncbi:uncharacterized protein BdWA1_003611 [Babesia duncani]|uniref:Uncharacterized protein n=1 Tax=Babesia duncani TaxID=323732 RepID=A0AAD9UME2_9APIC|nr:hypothetical protein BdWA1_003611 [Babesia duncani]
MMNVYLDGSEFALKRFEVSSSKVSVFIASVQSVRSLATLLALVVGVILILIGDNFLSKDYRKYWNQAGAILSAFLLTFFAFLQLICFCSSHGHQYVVHYYWLHVASGLCVGLIQMYGFKIFGGEASYYSLGIQITGCFVSILHYTLKKVLNSFQLDLNFWLIAIHLFVVFLVAFLGFVVFAAAFLSPGSSSSPQTTEDAGYAVWGVLFVQSGLVFFIGFAFQEDLLFQEGFGITAGLLILAGFVNLIVFTVAILLPANSSSDSVLVALLFPTILAFVSGLLILYGFMFWGVIMFLVSVVLFIIFLMAAVVGFPSDPSKALGAWALLLILVVLMFLTILLYQAGYGTVAFLLFLGGVGTVVFTSASSGVSKNPPTFENFKLGVQGAWGPIVMTVIGLAFTFVFYPVICPILTVESSRHHTIILWALLIEFSSGVIVFLLTLYADIRWRWIKFKDYPRQYYNFLWLFLIPFLGFGLAFLWALHHPNSGFSNALRYGFLGGVLTCVYYISAENTTNVGFACMFHHAFQGYGGFYRKFIYLDDDAVKKLELKAESPSGKLNQIESVEKVKKALEPLKGIFSGLTQGEVDGYSEEFKKVFNGLTGVEDSKLSPGSDGKLEKFKDDKKETKSKAVDALEGKLSFVSDTGLKIMYAEAFINGYNNAVEVDSDSAVKSELNSALTKASTTEAQIKSALGNSPKFNLLSTAQVAAYAKAAKGGSSKKAGRRAVGVVAAAELAGCIACAGPGDAPILVRNGIVSSSNTVKFESKHDDAAGDVMTFGIFWNNLFSVYFLYLMDAHLSNFFMYTGKLAEGHVFPTASMNGFRSCWFWFSCASSGAWKNFISMFSLDIKEMLLS